jgi:hypothetical protein
MLKGHCSSLIIVFLLLATFIACKNTQKTVPADHNTGKLNFGVLRYDSAALEYRLDSIHNRGLVLQFVQKEAGNNNTAFQLISYAFDTLNDHNNSWMPDTLAIITDSLPKNFSGKITIGNNEITREQLLHVVRDEQGQRFSYDYVLFTPVVEGVFHHVVYLMRAIKENGEATKGKTQMSSPAPPARNWY